MENPDHPESLRGVTVPPLKPFVRTFKSECKETFFPDDPFRRLKNQPPSRKILLLLQYFIPIFGWAPTYTLQLFKSDLIAGVTIASLGVPQGISYANLASIPPIIGLYSSFVPPIVYAMLGSSKDMAIGPGAVCSLLLASMLGKKADPVKDAEEYLGLVFTATFFAGLFGAALGTFRLGFLVDFLSHASVVGFMSGTATIVCLQQLKSFCGLAHFTHKTDVINVLHSIFSQISKLRWESFLLGFSFLALLLPAKYCSKKGGAFFWINAIAPLGSVVLGSLFVYLTHANKHGVQVIGDMKKGINPPSISMLAFGSPHLMTAVKTGIVTAAIALAESVAVSRSFAMMKNYHIDGNKEMFALGTMNIVGSFVSCYLTQGPFSRTAVNVSAGSQTPVSNIVMAMVIMLTLLFLTPLFYYTPQVVLAAIIVTAMLGLIKYEAAIQLWKIDKADFVICISAYIGVVFDSIETGIMVAITLSVARLLLRLARPKTKVLGNIPNSEIYKSIDQYPSAGPIPGVLILQIDSPIYFPSANYLRERITRWIEEEEERIKQSTVSRSLKFIIIDMSPVSGIDTGGIQMLEEVKKLMDRRDYKLMLADLQSEVVKKLDKAGFLKSIGQEGIYLTVGDAVRACNYKIGTSKDPMVLENSPRDGNV